MKHAGLNSLYVGKHLAHLVPIFAKLQNVLLLFHQNSRLLAHHFRQAIDLCCVALGTSLKLCQQFFVGRINLMLCCFFSILLSDQMQN